MNSNPLISVIMNCYNSSSYVREAIESVIAQTCKNWEIIFWDNQSEDKSAEIFKSYNDGRLKYFYASKHTSLSTARNLAIKKVNGQILAFLDCDDIWLPNKLEEQIKGFYAADNVGIVYSDFYFLKDSNSKSAKSMLKSFSRFRYHAHGPQSIYRNLLRSNFIIFSCVLIKKSVFDATNGFSDQFNHNEDYELLLKCSGISDAVCVNSKVLKYRIHANNNSYANMEIGYLENRAIFKELRPSKWVTKANNINEARYAIYLFLRERNFSRLSSFFNMNIIGGLIGLILRRIHFALYGINNV